MIQSALSPLILRRPCSHRLLFIRTLRKTLSATGPPAAFRWLSGSTSKKRIRHNNQDDNSNGANKRTEFEETSHLARGLSKFNISPQQQQKWKKLLLSKSTLDPDPFWENMEPLETPPFPPYEAQGLQDIHQKSFDANVLLEIRDVRLPASTHHPSFTRLARHRRHLICYTHADLIDATTRDQVEDWTLRSWPQSRPIFLDTREHRSDLPYDLVYESLLQHLDERGGSGVALTVGLPNVGKSSLLMALLRLARQRGEIPKQIKAAVLVHKKKGKKSKTKRMRFMSNVGAPPIEDRPGKTRTLTEYLLRESPRTFFLDVPGMTPPPDFFYQRPEAWFGLAAANLIKLSQDLTEDVEAQTTICSFVLSRLNQTANFGYVSKCGLEAPTHDIEQVLTAVKRGRGNVEQDEEKLQLKRCQTFLKLMNTGNFGPVILDDLRQTYKPFVFRGTPHENTRKSSWDDDEGFYDGPE